MTDTSNNLYAPSGNGFNHVQKNKCREFLLGLSSDHDIIDKLHAYRSDQLFFDQVINWVVELDKKETLIMSRVEDLLLTGNMTQEQGHKHALKNACQSGQVELVKVLKRLVREDNYQRAKWEHVCS